MNDLLTGYCALLAARLAQMGVVVDDRADRALDGFRAEIAQVLPPKERLFPARNAAGDLTGCGSLKDIGAGKGALKRLSVKPEARGTGPGRALVARRIEAARAMGLSALPVDRLQAHVEMRGLSAKRGAVETVLDPESASDRRAREFLRYLSFFRMAL